MTTLAEAPLCLPPIPMSRSPRVALPDGAVDSHFHVFREAAPLASPRDYTPHMLTLSDWQQFAGSAGVTRGVLVQPSVYGFDNSVMLEAIATAPDRLRGIAVVDPDVSDSELQQLHAAGVRGVRCNTRNLGGLGFEVAVTLAPRIAPLGWTMQFQVHSEQLAELADISETLGLPVVLDHFGFIDAGSDREPLRRLLDTGSCFVKLSAPYRLGSGHDSAATSDLVRDLVRSHPERLLWGSDWPHTGLWNGMPDDADLIDELVAMLGDDALRQSIFVDAPHALFFSS